MNVRTCPQCILVVFIAQFLNVGCRSLYQRFESSREGALLQMVKNGSFCVPRIQVLNKTILWFYPGRQETLDTSTYLIPICKETFITDKLPIFTIYKRAPPLEKTQTYVIKSSSLHSISELRKLQRKIVSFISMFLHS